ADSVLLGRAFIYALATHGQRGVENLLTLIEKEMRVAMTLTSRRLQDANVHNGLLLQHQIRYTQDALDVLKPHQTQAFYGP
ncbi:alpha-hydroxy-acid oxidizing protein, partial [Pantoea agglomerans]|uniref:alpha-hydroxy-acid oxidizing protein n=1 Tax=Enterobacter agglomerans TaxID=549 RepID=UPI001F5CB62D